MITHSLTHYLSIRILLALPLHILHFLYRGLALQVPARLNCNHGARLAYTQVDSAFARDVDLKLAISAAQQEFLVCYNIFLNLLLALWRQPLNIHSKTVRRIVAPVEAFYTLYATSLIASSYHRSSAGNHVSFP